MSDGDEEILGKRRSEARRGASGVGRAPAPTSGDGAPTHPKASPHDTTSLHEDQKTLRSQTTLECVFHHVFLSLVGEISVARDRTVEQVKWLHGRMPGVESRSYKVKRDQRMR